jgi:toxin ParE1/3/4
LLIGITISLAEYPERGKVTPEEADLRELLYGKSPNVYRVIYAIDQSNLVTTVLHIRHGARQKFGGAGAEAG